MSRQAPAIVPVALDAVVADLLVRRRDALHLQGIELRQHLRPVEVFAEPQALAELIDAALAWASMPGVRLLVRVDLLNWPEHGLLALRATPAVHLSGEAPTLRVDGPLWDRLSAAAQGLGVQLSQERTQDYTDLTLEFPCTARHVSALTALDVDRLLSPDTLQMTTGGRAIAGARILLVTGDATLAQAVSAVCVGMDLRLQCAADSRQAARLCELSPPDLIIIDAHQNDADFQQLHADLLREQMHFPVVEVAPAATIPEMASWEGWSVSRVGRDAVRSQLPSALALALAR